jgi:hypothetical protein
MDQAGSIEGQIDRQEYSLGGELGAFCDQLGERKHANKIISTFSLISSQRNIERD